MSQGEIWRLIALALTLLLPILGYFARKYINRIDAYMEEIPELRGEVRDLRKRLQRLEKHHDNQSCN